MIWMEVHGTWLLVTDIIGFRPNPAYDLRTEVIMRSGTTISVACTVDEFRGLMLQVLDALNDTDDPEPPTDDEPELEIPGDDRAGDAWGADAQRKRAKDYAQDKSDTARRTYFWSLTKVQLIAKLQNVGVEFQTAKPTKEELVDLAMEHLR